LPKVTLCVIARNEEALIGRCLASVAGAVDQIVVVDTGSSDRTVDRARASGAEVSSFEWCDDFAEARNASIERARGEWVLVLDADEQLTPESGAALKTLLAGAPAAAFWVVVRNLQPPGELVRYQDSPIVRLFRNEPAHRYRGSIHESVTEAVVEAGGRVAPSPLVIVHDGYAQASVQGGVNRATRNLALLQAAFARAPGDAYLQYQLGVTHQQLGSPRQARRHLRQAMDQDDGTLSVEVRALTATRLAQLALGDGRHGSAVEYAGRALAVDPRVCIARVVLAVALVRLHRFEEALPHLEWLQLNGRSQLSVAEDVDTLAAACRSQVAGHTEG
jgi:tetratricopeptide (TPR) repeat protein